MGGMIRSLGWMCVVVVVLFATWRRFSCRCERRLEASGRWLLSEHDNVLDVFEMGIVV